MAEKLKWETKKVKVKDLIELDINPRKISEAKKQKLIESLEKFNLAEIPAVNTDMQIIGGNQRVSALMMVGRGEEEIDVRVPNRKLTKKEVKEYAIISNTHAGEFDFEILDLEFADIEIGELGFEIEGWDDWKNKQDTLLASEAQEDDFEVPVGGSETDIVEGDIFDIGQHRLLCGSSTQTDTWKRLMGDELADLVITDPPYNINFTGRSNGHKIKNDNQSNIDFYQFLYDFYTALGAFTKSGATWYVWHSEKERVNFQKAMVDAGIELKQNLIWFKNNIGMGSPYRWQHEPCLFGCRVGTKYLWYSDKSQTTVLKFDRPHRNTEHPTMKPIPLIAYQMGNSSKADDIVCDGFGGSGTTMVAAQQTKRRCRMMELDPRYCQVIIDRMRKLEPGIQILKNGKEI